MSLVDHVSLPGTTVTFDPRAFDEAIDKQGVRLVHYKALRCPVGLVDLFDARRPDHDHADCSNGFLYERAGEVRALFTGNDESYQKQDIGFVDGSNVQATVSRYYLEDGADVYTAAEVMVAPFDRFYLSEEAVTVPTWQLFESHVSGVDRLQFPAVVVERLVGPDGREYREGSDFELQKGRVRWISSDRPRFDAERDRGAVCSVRFRYRPYFYCARMPHQIRVAQVDDVQEGTRRIVRMPQALVLAREYVHQNASGEATDTRQPPSPSSGSFGPR